jgi:hypothetical protein
VREYEVYEGVEAGDIVEVVSVGACSTKIYLGMQGVVVDRKTGDQIFVGVDFFDYVDGHDCSNCKAHKGHGWYVGMSKVKVIWRMR